MQKGIPQDFLVMEGLEVEGWLGLGIRRELLDFATEEGFETEDCLEIEGIGTEAGSAINGGLATGEVFFGCEGFGMSWKSPLEVQWLFESFGSVGTGELKKSRRCASACQGASRNSTVSQNT